MRRMKTRTHHLLSGLVLLTASLTAVQCATNPATGQRQIAMMSEEREIEMGREADEQITASMGLVDDDELARYVDQIGQRLAATSERAHLEWSFRVIDDASVNAFALPGGWIYVTRGILAHMNSEGELAGVLGHEIGHVTGRHSVNRLSKQQLGNIGLAAASVAASMGKASGASWAGWANAGAQLGELGASLMFLKFSRNHESQADDLGLRYMTRGNYDPREMPGVFAMLEAVSGQAEGGRMPGWLATHPNPEARGERSVAAVAALGDESYDGRVGTAEFFEVIEGISFGANPREGYFRDALFLHPDMKFQFAFPDGWTTQNQKTQVLGINSDKDVLIQLTLADAASAADAAREFLNQEGMDAGRPWSRKLNGLQASGGGWEVSGDDRTFAGQVVFLDYGDNVFQINSMGLEDDFGRERAVVRQSLRSFRSLKDPEVLAVEPFRLEIVTVSAPATLTQLAERMKSPVPVETLAVVNRRAADDEIPAGTRIKMVVGKPLP